MIFTVKFKGITVGVSSLEKGDPPMGVAFGFLEPTCAVENTLGEPLNSGDGIKGWEGFNVYLNDGRQLKCHSTYLEQVDLGEDGRIYQVSCHGIHRHFYEELFQHHIEAYDNSFT